MEELFEDHPFLYLHEVTLRGFKRIKHYNNLNWKFYFQKKKLLKFINFFEKEIKFYISMKNSQYLGVSHEEEFLNFIKEEIRISKRLLVDCRDRLTVVNYSIKWCQNQIDHTSASY